MFTKQELELILALFESDAAMVAALTRLGRPDPPLRIALLANLRVKVLEETAKLQQAEVEAAKKAAAEAAVKETAAAAPVDQTQDVVEVKP